MAAASRYSPIAAAPKIAAVMRKSMSRDRRNSDLNQEGKKFNPPMAAARIKDRSKTDNGSPARL